MEDCGKQQEDGYVSVFHREDGESCGCSCALGSSGCNADVRRKRGWAGNKVKENKLGPQQELPRVREAVNHGHHGITHLLLTCQVS